MDRKYASAIIWGSVFIIGGILWLLSNLGVITFNVVDLWPLIFVVIGVQIIVDAWGKEG